MNLWARPSIGFVVEGAGEYHCYPSLVNRIAETDGCFYPRVNAGGCGASLTNLEENLSDLVKSHHPHSIIVTLDLSDIINGGHFETCTELLTSLQGRANDWLLGANEDSTLEPLPDSLKVVLQVQKFESWLIADLENLKSNGVIAASAGDGVWNNVDEQVSEPYNWIRSNCTPGQSLNPKNRRHAKKILALVDVATMENCSRSFRKFAKEVRLSYETWLASAMPY